jgi:hypothetical protein
VKGNCIRAQTLGESLLRNVKRNCFKTRVGLLNKYYKIRRADIGCGPHNVTLTHLDFDNRKRDDFVTVVHVGVKKSFCIMLIPLTVIYL